LEEWLANLPNLEPNYMKLLMEVIHPDLVHFIEILLIDRVMSFKGENINGFHVDDRTPDPKRMTEGYFKSAAIMNYIRQMKGVDVSCSHFNEKITNLNSEIVSDSSFKSPFYKENIE